MVSTSIRETIHAALRNEDETHQLRSRIEQQLPLLQEKLVLPEQDPVSTLMGFSIGYVKSVPSCLRLVTAVSKRMGFFSYAAPFLHLAEDYFLQPPDELPQDGGLEALLDEAFLALRLLEEISDHHMRQLQRPLLPLDMTEANAIVHHLLGDEFATRMEHLVQFTAARFLHREHMWDQVRDLPGSFEIAKPLFSSANLTGSTVKIRLRLAS